MPEQDAQEASDSADLFADEPIDLGFGAAWDLDQPGLPRNDSHEGDGEPVSRVLSLGVDSQGGYAVPNQLDKGYHKRRPKSR